MISPFEKTKEQFLTEAIEDCESDKPVDRVHALVWGQVQYSAYNKDRIQFFNAPTGTGKTTGFQLAVKKAWDTMWKDMPVLVLCPTRQDANQMYLDMEAIEEGCAGVWTHSHDPEHKTLDPTFTPTKYFTKSEAAKKKCLIVTHNAGRYCGDWIGRRDLVLCDEDPESVVQSSVQVYEFVRARDAEAKSGLLGPIFGEAAQWAEDQAKEGLSTVSIPAWVPKLLANDPATSEGQAIKELAIGISEGRVFQSRTKSTSWTVYEYKVFFQNKTIIFSATSQFAGWQYGENPEFIDHLLPQIDYSPITFIYRPWPVGLPLVHKAIQDNYTYRNRFIDELKDMIPFHSDRTLIVCPLTFRSEIEATFPSAKVTNYGRDVGSNEYRDCNDVYIVSLFHKPVDVLRGDNLAYSGVEIVTDEALHPLQNSQGKTVKRLKDDNHRVHLQQMISRCNLRNITSDGKSGEARVTCLFSEDIFSRLLPELFLGAKLVYPKGALVRKSGDTTPIVTKAVRYLSTVPEDQEFVGSPELKESGIIIKGSAKQKQIAIGEAQFLNQGWFFRGGTAGRYGRPSGFHRF